MLQGVKEGCLARKVWRGVPASEGALELGADPDTAAA